MSRLWSRISPWGGVICAAAFFLAGCIFYSYPGVEVDEAMFATPQYRDWCFYSLPFGHHRLPLMHMPYIGALKTWLYSPLLAVLPPTPMVLRLPAVLLGSATILFFWILLHRIHGRRAAWVGCILLTTDTTFLLTTTFDWGPVALQHFLMVAAMMLAVRWYQAGATWALAAAAFCCGLGLWDKAVFIWIFSGLCAGLLLFTRNILRKLKWRQTVLSVAALCLGALPLILYNLASNPRLATFQSAAHFNPRDFPLRVADLRASWDGSGLFALFLNDDSASRPRTPRTLIEHASFQLHAVSGDRRANAFEPALVVAVLLIPFLWRTRARNTLLFCLISGVAAWLVMLLSGGGLFVHHTVLLSPLPHLLIAVALAEASFRLRFGRWAIALILVFLALANIVVTNEYLYRFIRNGARERWTDGIYPLADGLRRIEATQLIFPDWGMLDSICVLNRNSPPTRLVLDPLGPTDLEVFQDPKAIWVEHTVGNEITEGVNARVLDAARKAGFEAVPVAVHADSNGRPMFQTLRFVKSSPPPI